MKQAIRWTAVLALTLGGLAGCASTDAVTRGHDAREDLSEHVEDVSAGVEQARLQLERAVEAYARLVALEADDPMDGYQDLAKALERGRERQEELHEALGAMEQAAARYFSTWEGEIDGFLNETMQARAARRLETVRKRYDNMRESLEPALVGTGMVLDRLQDQVLFLKFDLSPQAISLLQRDATALGRDRQRLAGRMEAIQDTADRFAESLGTEGGDTFGRDDTGDLPTDNPVQDGD